MVDHVVMITGRYAQGGRTPVLAQAWSLVLTYPGMVLATAGTGLLIAAVALSIRAARRHLRWESRHLSRAALDTAHFG